MDQFSKTLYTHKTHAIHIHFTPDWDSTITI